MANNKFVLRRTEIAALEEARRVHQFNDRAVRHTRSLGDIVGLDSVGIHLVRVEPGVETTQHHNHEFSDEFVYILEGTAELVIDETPQTLTAGDFAGFPRGGPAHSMKNVGETDLLYLMGGGRPDIDICNYPRIRRRMYIVNGHREFVDLDNLGRVVPVDK